MELFVNRLRRASVRATCVLCGAAVLSLCVSTAVAIDYSYSTTDPEIEMWFYPASSANGLGSVRDRGPTFAAFSTTLESGQADYYEGSGLDPTRRGSFIVASNTSTTIPRLEDPSRYRIDSLKLTLTLLGGMGPIVYDNTAETAAALTTPGADDAGRPIEMWGVGFGGAYETFGFAGESDPKYFNEGDRRWPIAAGSFSGPYQLYPTDPAGSDVSNSVVGGYSATEATQHTGQFTPTPYSIGKVYDQSGAELTPGAMVPVGSQFVFEPNLSNPEVVAYIQRSLSAGNLGFFFSSLHEPLGHTGATPYPDFFLDNNPTGPNPNGNAPTVEIQVTVLDPILQGDYDANGVVDHQDYDVWRQTVGSSVALGVGADGNRDAVVDAADYLVWRKHMGGSGSGAGVTGAAVVPEPGAAFVAVACALSFGCVRGRPVIGGLTQRRGGVTQAIRQNANRR